MTIPAITPRFTQTEHSEVPLHPGGDTPCERPFEERGPPNASAAPLTERRSRIRTDAVPVGKRAASVSTSRRIGSLLPRPYLLASDTAWVFLDFAVAFCCTSILVVAQASPVARFLISGQSGTEKAHSSLLPVIGISFFSVGVAALSQLFGLHPFRKHGLRLPEPLLLLLAVVLPMLGFEAFLRPWTQSSPTLDTLQLLLTWSLLMVCRALWRRHWNSNFLHDIAAKNVLIVGANDCLGGVVRDYLGSLHHLGYRFKGFISLDEHPSVGIDLGGKEIVGSVKDVISLARSMYADEIIFCSRPAQPDLLDRVLHQARSMGIDVRLIPSVSETLSNRQDVQYLGDLPTIVLHHRKKRPLCNLVKRAMDITLGAIGIVAASPICLVIAILIKHGSAGPVFYRSDRVGYKGTSFNCYKFRTMMDKAESMQGQLAHMNERHEILFKIASDPRVTEIGSILRKYSLDELPQLWNVLLGDMSLVGPRPSLRSEVAQYKTAHLRRLDVVPGMTGLWQVEARHDPSFESYIRLDSTYVEEWSIWLDMKIMLRTITIVLRGTGT